MTSTDLLVAAGASVEPGRWLGNQQLRQRVTDLEYELAAARTSLRQMIRDTSKG
jgi:hypothetical protein